MKVLVCGGRNYRDRKRVWAELDHLHATRGVDSVIQGGASGADALAKQWATCWGFRYETYAADWQRHGRAAGPIRNARMLHESKPDLVLAFPGGRDTADMVRRAREAGVAVTEVRDETD